MAEATWIEYDDASRMLLARVDHTGGNVERMRMRAAEIVAQLKQHEHQVRSVTITSVASGAPAIACARMPLISRLVFFPSSPPIPSVPASTAHYVFIFPHRDLRCDDDANLLAPVLDALVDCNALERLELWFFIPIQPSRKNNNK